MLIANLAEILDQHASSFHQQYTHLTNEQKGALEPFIKIARAVIEEEKKETTIKKK